MLRQGLLSWWEVGRTWNIHLCLLVMLIKIAQLSEAGSSHTRHRRQAIDFSDIDCLRNDGSTSEIVSYSISEDALPGAIIGVLPLKGQAVGVNTTISLSLTPSEDAQFVSLNISEKTLLLQQEVDPDIPLMQTRLALEVTCNNLALPGGAVFSATYRININIININDNTPMFVGLPYHANLSELTLVDTIVFNGVSAVDTDGANSNGQVIYSVVYNPNDPEASDYFTIKNGGRGEVWLLRPLDYESKKTWEILLSARDNGNMPRSNTTTLLLNVYDGEDLPPQFLPCNTSTGNLCQPVIYSTTILEKANVSGPLVFEPGPISAFDADLDVTTNGPIQYILSAGYPPEYVDYFSMDMDTGEVFLMQPVNRADFKEFMLEVTARESELEGGLYAITTATITIQEVNEHHPVFAQSQYHGFVYENSLIGSQVSMSEFSMVPLKLHASDMDVDPGRPLMLSYYLSDSTAHFILEPGPDGSFAYVVVSSNALDRELVNNYTIRALAVENDTNDMLESESTTIDITVLDVNDNPPEFLPNEHSDGPNRYRGMVEENAGPGKVIMTLQTTDLDLPPHDPVIFVINYINNEGETKLGQAQASPSSVNIILKENGTIVEGEEYSISMQAIDGGKNSLMSAVVYIEILVQPANVSHTPTFEQDVYEASASEGLPQGAFVTTVTAIDKDEDSIFYNITDGDVDGVFTVDSASGEVKVVGTLDRETTASYTLRIQASDGFLSSTCTLLVTILDVNDNDPVFNASQTVDFLVLEGLENEFVGMITAYDIDEPGTPNSLIEYSLVSEAFRIDPNDGMIFTIGALDREHQERYELEVVAKDTAPSPRSATLQVVVVVQDVNDNSPVFEPSEYSVDVPENHLARGFLVLEALDRDAAAVLEYLIKSGDKQIFTIASGNGSLSLLKELDYEASQTYTLQVTVRDTGNTDFNSTATVTVNVLDENDHDPVFAMASYQGAVLRAADLGTVAASGITATDGDQADTVNGQVMYNIMPASVYFTIPDPMVGVIVTKTSLQNAPESNNLTIVAYDNGSPSRSQTATVIILVRMERPVFPQSVYMVNDLKEEEPPGTRVVELQASANQGDQIEYQITAGDTDGNFEMVSENNVGTIFTMKALDREAANSFTLTVQANLVQTSTGAGNSRRKKRQAANVNEVEVVIDLVDINDNAPMFEQSTYYIGVSDSAGIGTTVLKMAAVDLDSNNNSLIDYSMDVVQTLDSEGQVDELSAAASFSMETSTGIIRTDINELALEPRIFTYVVFGQERFGPAENVANTTLTISLINEDNRVVLATNISPGLMRENLALVEATLEDILGAEVIVDDVGVRLYGDNLEKSDPSGSDIQFYVIDPETGKPFTSDELIELLKDFSRVDPVLQDFSQDGQGKVIEVRKPRTGRRPLTFDAEPTVEAIALLCLAVALFILCILAIAVVVVSWKKYSLVLGYRREMEREKQARLYLPMYNTHNPYSMAEDHEIAGPSVPDGRIFTTPSAANPIYLDDHAIQVYPSRPPPRSSVHRHHLSSFAMGPGVEVEDNDALLFTDGAPSFMKPRETQEHTMDFDDEMSSSDGPTDEATAAANTIADAVRSESSRRSSKKSSNSKTPSSSGPPSYSSNQGNYYPAPPINGHHEVSTIPYRHDSQSPPKEPLRPPPLFDPRPTPTSDPRSPFESGSYDNYGADLDDGISSVGSPMSGPRTNSSMSTNKPGSVERSEWDRDPFLAANKNVTAGVDGRHSSPWQPSEAKLSHVALDDSTVKLVHMEEKEKTYSKQQQQQPPQVNTPSRTDAGKVQQPIKAGSARKGSRRKHKRSQRPHRTQDSDSRNGSTSSDDAVDARVRLSVAPAGGRTGPTPSQSLNQKRRTSDNDSNFSFQVYDGYHANQTTEKDSDVLKPIYQYTQPPWNDLDIMNTVL